MTYQYSFKDLLQRAERITWRVEDLIGGDKKLDFKRPFMPESFARTAELDFLSADEKRTLNQIRGASYLAIFGLVEEFILPFVLDHARPYLNGEDYRLRAFLEFASEEAKHIHLFHRFREDFTAGFGVRCDVIGPPEAIAAHVLAQPPLGVALLILHIEWMTQRHYLDSVKDERGLDAQFKSLLKHHWMEEAQHTKLDTLMIEALAEGRGEAELEKALGEYLEIGGFLDEGFRQQTEFNLENLQISAGRMLSGDERAEFMTKQHQALRWTFLGSGMTHANFLATLERLSPALRKRVEQVAPVFC
jgi:primosomal replication protein N